MEMPIARFVSDDFTTRSYDVEAVCNTTTNVVEDGVAHLYTVNPSGVAIVDLAGSDVGKGAEVACPEEREFGCGLRPR